MFTFTANTNDTLINNVAAIITYTGPNGAAWAACESAEWFKSHDGGATWGAWVGGAEGDAEFAQALATGRLPAPCFEGPWAPLWDAIMDAAGRADEAEAA